MNLIQLGCRWRQNSDGASAGRVVSYLTLGTCSSPPVQTLRWVNSSKLFQLSRHMKRSGKRGMHVYPGKLSECSQERIKMQHAERRTCQSGRMLLLSFSMTKHHLHLTEISELSLSTRWIDACTQLTPAFKEYWHYWSISLPLSNNVHIDGANLSGCHRS